MCARNAQPQFMFLTHQTHNHVKDCSPPEALVALANRCSSPTVAHCKMSWKHGRISQSQQNQNQYRNSTGCCCLDVAEDWQLQMPFHTCLFVPAQTTANMFRLLTAWAEAVTALIAWADPVAMGCNEGTSLGKRIGT